MTALTGHDLANSLTPIIYKLTVLADDLADLPGPAPGAASAGEGGAPNEADRLIQQALEGAERVRIIVPRVVDQPGYESNLPTTRDCGPTRARCRRCGPTSGASARCSSTSW